jgi:hypothetical protein
MVFGWVKASFKSRVALFAFLTHVLSKPGPVISNEYEKSFLCFCFPDLTTRSLTRVYAEFNEVFEVTEKKLSLRIPRGSSDKVLDDMSDSVIAKTWGYSERIFRFSSRVSPKPFFILDR